MKENQNTKLKWINPIGKLSAEEIEEIIKKEKWKETKKLPDPPKPPLIIIEREPILLREGVFATCSICQSSMVRKPIIFGRRYCINPECPNSIESELLEKCKIAVEKEICKECRQEALKILEFGDDKDRKDFLKYHKKDQGNICCLVLDFAKKKLVDASKMEQKKDDCFHHSYDFFKLFEENE